MDQQLESALRYRLSNGRRKVYFVHAGSSFFLALVVLLYGGVGGVTSLTSSLKYTGLFIITIIVGLFFIDRGRGRPYKETREFIIEYLLWIPFSPYAMMLYIILVVGIIATAFLLL